MKSKLPTSSMNTKEELHFLYNLLDEENKAIDMLHLANSTMDSKLQMEAIAKLRRVCFDFFGYKYLKYEGIQRGQSVYTIDYSYHKEYQENKQSFSIRNEIEIIENKPPLGIPLPIGLME